MDKTISGLIRGLRYITNMFEQDKEEEIQIGPPTDVRHVAHIGGDGPANNKPSWMNGFPTEQEPAQKEDRKEKPAVEENPDKPKQKSRRKSSSNGSDISVTSPKGSDKPSRHHRNPSGGSVDNDSPNHRRRRHRQSKQDNDMLSSDQPPVPKHNRRKKSSTSSPGGSKERNSLTDIPDLV